MKPTFTDRELDIMAVLWDRGPSTVAEVRERLADDLAHNTVQTVLRILEEKGYVDHTEEGRAYRFAARVKREVAGATAAARMIDKLFAGSTERLLAHLVSERDIDARELLRLRRLLDAKIKESGK